MSHISQQLAKINENIKEAEAILNDLKLRPKSENVAEQIEHFESMLNKLNSLKLSYLRLSEQLETTNIIKRSILNSGTSTSNSGDLDNLSFSNGDEIEKATDISKIKDMLSSIEQLKKERDRLKFQLQERGIRNNSDPNFVLMNLPGKVLSNNLGNSNKDENSFDNSIIHNNQNSNEVDLSFYVSILNRHIDIGKKLINYVENTTVNENVQQALNLLREVMQRLVEMRERFECVQSAKESIENQTDVEEEIIQQGIASFVTITEDLKNNFATGIKCFKSAMDIIQSHLDPQFNLVLNDETEEENIGCSDFAGLDDFPRHSSQSDGSHISNGFRLFVNEETTGSNNNNSDSDSDNNHVMNNNGENNDAEDEDSNNSCREKDQDESMEVGISSAAVDSVNDQLDQEAMEQLRLQTEIEKKEILRLLEEKRIMQQKLNELKRAKEIAQNQMRCLTENHTLYDLSTFGSHESNDTEPDDKASTSNSQRPNTLALKTGNMVQDMESLLKLIMDMKVDDDSFKSRNMNSCAAKSPIKSNVQPSYNNDDLSYTGRTNMLIPEMVKKTDELKQKQSQIQQLQDMLNQIKKCSLNFTDSIIAESTDEYVSNSDVHRDINVRNQKGRDSVTFQEPVATFIANDELYENMREVRMRREELRDRSSRNSNSDPRSPAGRVMDNGNAPGAPPEVPSRLPNPSHETASQDRTTAATWGSSSAGGDDYEEGTNDDTQIGNESNLRIRSEGGSRNSAVHNLNDEGSRVAPIGQSSTFRSKSKDSADLRNAFDVDFNNLKSQIENIATLCRNMAVEQNRLARDMAELKRTTSPRLNTSCVPDMPLNSTSTATSVKHAGLANDDGLHWSLNNPVVNSLEPMTNISSSLRNCNSLTTADSTTLSYGHGIRTVGQFESNWDEASISSSCNAAVINSKLPVTYNPAFGYQNILNQQNMLLQNHTMFMKLQMSLIASQLEQQRLMCNLAVQQNNSLFPTNNNWAVRSLAPPFYPPPGPLSQTSWHMLQPQAEQQISSQQNFLDSDYMVYGYPPESRDTSSTTNQTPSNPNINLWKNPSGRNVHRN